MHGEFGSEYMAKLRVLRSVIGAKKLVELSEGGKINVETQTHSDFIEATLGFLEAADKLNNTMTDSSISSLTTAAQAEELSTKLSVLCEIFADNLVLANQARQKIEAMRDGGGD